MKSIEIKKNYPNFHHALTQIKRGPPTTNCIWPECADSDRIAMRDGRIGSALNFYGLFYFGCAAAFVSVCVL
jgi:hypothetical protein